MNAFSEYSIDDVIRYAVALIVLLTGLLAIIYAIWGGFLMIISGGNEEKVKKAVNHIRYAGLGLVGLIVIIFVLPFLFGLLNIPYFDFLKPSTIYRSIQEISNSVFNTNTTAPDAFMNEGPLPTNFTDIP